MSEFSQKLSEYIKQKDTNVYMLAKYCGYDRANMYKLINGKRNAPDAEFVKKLSEYLHLPPSEEQELTEKYHISVMGYENYHRRKNIMKFLSEFTLTEKKNSALSEINVITKMDETKENITLKGAYELESALLWMIVEETGKSQGEITMIMQPEIDMLNSILGVCGRTENNIRVDHIVCLSDQPDKIEDGKLYNLECLKKILPLYNYNYDYNTWYYYGNVKYTDNAFVMFPYMVMTSEYACLISADMKNGCLTRDKELIQMLTERFEKFRKKSRRLINCIGNIMEQFEEVGNTVSTRYAGYSLQMEPCLMGFLDREMIEKYLTQQMPNRAFLVEATTAYCEKLSAQNITYIFSMEGLFHFLETGNIRELPPELYEKPVLEDRIRIGEKILSLEKEKRVRILKQGIGHPETDVNIFVTSEHGLLRVSVPTKRVFLDMILEESGVLYSFYDFCESMGAGMFYGKEEAEKMIREKIKMLREN